MGVVWVRGPVYKDRLDKDPAEICRELEARKMTQSEALEAFVATTEPGTFGARYDRLSRHMQLVVREVAEFDILRFDEIVATFERNGEYSLGWVAFRDWATSQPWADEARVVARAREERDSRIDWSGLGRRLHEQAVLLAALRVRAHSATSEEERQALLAEAERLESEFHRDNFGTPH